VAITGRATDFYGNRNWNSYYWREDFSFVVEDEAGGKTWRVLSREPTPAYHWRMGTTYPGLKVNWKARPRVKVFGVTGVDRIPTEFYGFKLDEANLATALVVWVESGPGRWEPYYVNNWFHRWGDKADRAAHKLYAGRAAPFDVYGFIGGQAAPFSRKSRDLIAKHKKARMFHGLIRAAGDNPFGYEIDLLHLFGPDAQGNGVVFFGDPKRVPLLDEEKPKKGRRAAVRGGDRPGW